MTIRVPAFLKPVAGLIKYVIRSVVYWRLSRWPVSMSTAEYWAGKIKDWPAIFVHPGFNTEKRVTPGIQMNLGVVDVIERNIFVHGVWDPIVGRALDAFLKPGNTFLDIGANIGYFSLYASTLVGSGGQVIAVEPSRRALEKLLVNLRLNKTGNVLILSVAAGERTGQRALRLATPNNIGASSLRATLESMGSEAVAVVRLDGVIMQLGVIPDLIKIDIEGAELSALKGLEEILKTARPMVLVELTDSFLRDSGESALELVAYMSDLGYRCYELGLSPHLKGRLIRKEFSQVPKQQTEVLFSRQDLEEFEIEVVPEATC